MERVNGNGVKSTRQDPSLPKPKSAINEIDPPDTKQSLVVEYLRFGILALCFTSAAIGLHLQQWVGVPLRLFDQALFDSWQTSIKKAAATLVLGLNHWRAPVEAQISTDASVKFQKQDDGTIVPDFPKRMVLVANHQLYTDWLFLWWSAYSVGHHAYLFIVLKDAIKKIPILGSGMTFFNWIFLSRNWETDQASLEKSLSQLSGPGKSNPMWLLIFPEGTNLSKRSLKISRKWAEKNDLSYSDLTLLPRSRGLWACLKGLKGSVEWMYDCTIAYDNIPRDQDGQDIYNLRSLYIEGKQAPRTHTYWRRFAINDMPLHDQEAFDQWLRERWAEKDVLLEHFRAQGSFPAHDGYMRTNIKLRQPTEVLWIVFTTALTVIAAVLGLRWLFGGLVAICAKQ